jgi:glycosyltransferase involved in cell wall biosynthesis
MEQLLEDLDRLLLSRNAMTLVRIYIARDRNRLEERYERIGRGTLVRVPFPLPEGDSLQLASDYEASAFSLKRALRQNVLYNPLVWTILTKRLITRWKIPLRRGQLAGVGAKVADLIDRYSVDLIMLHFFGGSDSDEIVEVARKRRLPFALQNHYSNDRFMHLSIRKHAVLANGVSGVSGVGLPKYLRGRFWNLSDGIDTEFFTPANVKLHSEHSKLTILLPARVVKPKGHLDLIKAGGMLRDRGLDIRIAFAGRTDSVRFEQELREEIVHRDLSGKVQFLGSLTQEELRDWYAASSVVAFPTYHHEGLGRVIVEAQAMKVPPVAYATGGVPEGMIPGKTGFLLRTGDIRGLADRLEELLRNNEMREQMGEEGRKFVEETFSLDALAKRHEDFYTSVLSNAKNLKRRGRYLHV